MANATRYDAIIIGSGFGGTMCAYVLVHSGQRVLMLERGERIARDPRCWAPEGTVFRTPAYSYESAYTVRGSQHGRSGAVYAVGGPSIYYGAVSFRLREQDFRGAAAGAGWPGARWPFGYDELEPYYGLAEEILRVTGETGVDPTEPPRSTPLRSAPALSAPSRLIGDAARRLGLSPFHLPLAINFAGDGARPRCARCATCDSYACAITAKNDLSTGVLPGLEANGLELRPNAVAVRLIARRRRIVAVQCIDRSSGEPFEVRADQVILAAGALATPHLLLASGLEALNPGGWTIGRHLMRHCNGIVYGWFPGAVNPSREFHKQIGIHDFYNGHPAIDRPAGKLGALQQIHAPPVGLIPRALRGLAGPIIDHATGLLAIAEDQPNPRNCLRLERGRTDRFGLPRARIDHTYSRRDLAARRALGDRAAEILKLAGAALTWRFPIMTFSHALGTVRMGSDPRGSALDADGAFRGIENLHVTDASSFPTAGGVNPSLTVAATALRAGEHLAGASTWRDAVFASGLVRLAGRRAGAVSLAPQQSKEADHE